MITNHIFVGFEPGRQPPRQCPRRDTQVYIHILFILHEGIYFIVFTPVISMYLYMYI